MSMETNLDRQDSNANVLPTILLATGIAIAAGGSYFGLQAQTAYDATNLAVGGQSSIESGKRSQLIANILYGTGALVASGINSMANQALKPGPSEPTGECSIIHLTLSYIFSD